MSKYLPLILALFWPVFARAHDGHGLTGPAHGHGSDLLLPLLLLAAGVTTWWLARRK